MKTKILSSLILSSALVVLATATQVSARDLTYKFGFGYKQIYTNGFVNKAKVKQPAQQLNGLTASYGIARDFHIEANFAMQRDFDAFVLGPGVRYDIQRLFSQSLSAWNYLNIYTQAAFLVKAGDDVKMGVLIQLPYLGFEILPFEANDFAINAAAGFTFDFMSKTMFGFTNGMFGDVGLKYYF